MNRQTTARSTHRLLSGLILAAAISTFLLVAAGNAARVTGSAADPGCPDWPTCFGVWGIPAGAAQSAPLLADVAHRVLAGVSAALTLAAAGWAVVRRAKARLPRSLVSALALAALLIAAEVLAGARLAGDQSAAASSTLHLAGALLSLGLLSAAVTVAFTRRADPAHTGQLRLRSPFARLAAAGLASLFVLLVTGALVAATGAGAECSGWPLCAGGLPASPLAWLAFAHRGVVLLTGGLLAAQFFAAWKSQRSRPAALTAATAALVLVAGQVLIGALLAQRGMPAGLVGLHAAGSAGLWAVQVILVAAAGLDGRSAEDEAAEAAEPLPARRRFKDFIILSKPIIVLLLLVTTYAGMVVGGRAIPAWDLTLWTLLGGALAAGGASALNQYIDRDTDRDMQRTANRPLPGGRLQPAEGLAYGVGACIAAFFLLAGTVNLLTAVLSLAGMVYYVLIYSIWLKRLTVQNIVIGGGAGAIPPLVGWAAATGSLNIPALFLFAIIFFWTPPHFWALALVRRKDYARGRVPMLPVVRGEAETRRQIMIYTVELVALTLLLPVFNLAGTVYLVSAAALGLWLMHTAWKVYRGEGNKDAWKMYRYSSMYLAFLMLAMVADVLL